jgi:bifunctional aspartokinase / homoserine dehydrogenase 1
MTGKPALEIWKFGGASLADEHGVRRAADQISAHRGPLVVVASALAGVTDLLLTAAPNAADTFRTRHHAVARAIAKGADRDRLIAAIDAATREYEELCKALAMLGHIEARARDLLVSRGERMSSMLLAAAISAVRLKADPHKITTAPHTTLRGPALAGPVSATFVEATDVIATDAAYGNAAPELALTKQRAREILLPLLKRGMIPVVPGYIGRAPDGSLTTLGRGGTDLTATLIARSLGAACVVFWKDVPGILTADPRLVADARVIPHLHHREAAEVAHYGAKVLHPRALIPVSGTRIALRIRSFVDTTLPGTEVSAKQSLKGYPVKALAILSSQAVVTVAGKGMVGVHGIAARTFAAVDGAGVSVSTIFQASSESSIGFTVPEAQASIAVASLRQAFRHELDHGLIDGVTSRAPLAVIAVVGDGMVGTPGISARVFSALESGGINVVAIAQGSSERNISFVVADADAPEAARRVHTAFQLSKIGGGRPVSKPHTDVVLLGYGRVGRALTDQIVSSTNDGIRVVGLLDRSGYVFNANGLSRARLRELAKAKDKGALLTTLGGKKASATEALAVMSEHAVSRPVIVDVTSDDTGELLRTAVSRGFDVVLANKKPLAGSWDSYARLLDEAATRSRKIRYEATVGAGLPVIDTFRKLHESGDRVLRIDGCVSGTLMYVLSEVSMGRPFSQAVREAVARGYAEPDPRDDLSGRDAARKGLILARMIGYRGAAPAAHDLVPEAYRHLPLKEFIDRLEELDAAWQRRTEAETSRGGVLRYVVSATPRKVSAGLLVVPKTSPMGAAEGTRNIITFHSKRYKEPLVISGPGAGADVTAAGLLNDICSLGLA